MIELCNSRRGVSIEHRYIEEAENAPADSAPRVMINARLPLAEVVTDLFDTLKYRSSGYASFE
jgi:translation elongation factor EF-4